MTASFPASYPPQIRARSSCSRLRRLGLEERRDWWLERTRDWARVSTAHSSRILSSRWRADLPDLTRRWRGLLSRRRDVVDPTGLESLVTRRGGCTIGEGGSGWSKTKWPFPYGVLVTGCAPLPSPPVACG